ncbi:MAG: hypothetical protein QW707_08365 [Candidatus Bathyarchaeia archaeon]
MADSLPGCIGYYGNPMASNNCKTCRQSELCIKLSMRFVPKEALKPIHAALLRVEERLRVE